MINITRIRKTNQDWKKTFCSPREHIQSNPVGVLGSLPEKYRVVINYLLEMENKNYQEVYPTQTTLGRVMGCGRQRSNEIIGELQELGLITTNYRHMTSCLYKTTPFLKTPFMAQKLGHLFPALRKLLLLLAIPLSNGYIKGEATQGILKNYNVYGTRGIGITNRGILGKIQRFGMKYCPLPQCLVRQKLTVEQKCVLAAFPEWLLDQALFKITDMSRITNLGGYLYSYCSRYCHRPNWVWSSQLKDLYKDDVDYREMPVFADDEYAERYYPTKTYDTRGQGNAPRGNPQKERQEYRTPDPRRSPGGISPMVVTQRVPERLLPLIELRAQIEKYNAMSDKTLAALFVQGLMNRQAVLIDNLSPEELVFWNSQT